MRQLNGVYTQTFNRLHRRTGHLLQGRYKAILVEKESTCWSFAAILCSTRLRLEWPMPPVPGGGAVSRPRRVFVLLQGS
jgi:hypothetical protein